MAVMIFAMIGVTDRAEAQLPRYRLTPLVKLNLQFPPDADQNGTLGINNKGQVVFGYRNASNANHAWVWLPTTDYSFSAGFHDISDATVGEDGDNIAIARDINESGLVVGQAGALRNDSGGNGAAWQLSSNAATYTALPLFASGTFSSAHAVNDQSPVIIVGLANQPGYCDCLGASWSLADTPFSLSFSGTLSLTALSVGTDRDGEAQDVNTPQGGNPLRIAGFTDCVEGAEASEKEPCAKPGICRTPMNAVFWSPATRTELTDLGTSGARARGINDAEQIVGWGLTNAEDCKRRALYWSTPSSMTTPVNLGSTMPSGQSTNASRAEAINDMNPPQIVGWNDSVGGALLWEDPEGTPVVTDLNDAFAIGGCSSAWQLYEAHDVNDNGWIITWGNNTQETQYNWAILLTPFPECPVDIIETGCVDTDDIIAVIGAWGSCPIGSICHADVNGDCVVNTDDLIAVNGAWGCSPCGGGFAPPEPRTLEELIAIVLESGAPSETIAEIIEQLIANWP